MDCTSRFSRSYKVNDAGCWEWRRLTSNGYARFFYDGAVGYGHRYSWEQQHGLIPPGLELDHLCRNRGCVNPGHLALVTHRENIQRGREARIYCKRGHDMPPAGLCMVCYREGQQRFRDSHPGYRQRYAN